MQIHHARESSGESHAINDIAVAEYLDHFVLFGDVVQEGVLVVGEERVGHPDRLGKVAHQRQIVVLVAENQALVAPVLIQINGDRVVHVDLGDAVKTGHSNLHGNVQSASLNKKKRNSLFKKKSQTQKSEF